MTDGEKILLWLCAVSWVGIALMSYDKWAAKHRPRSRVRERTLWLVALSGGAAAAWAMMICLRHKTKHRSFAWGFPLCALVQAGLLVLYGLYREGCL